MPKKPAKKTAKKTPKKLGRPKVEIDFVECDTLCLIHCMLIEIADYFDCSEDTIERRVKSEKGMLFADYFKKRQGAGKRSLRRLQWEKAKEGNITMLIWLGKQYLGQKDKIENDVSSLKPIKILDGV